MATFHGGDYIGAVVADVGNYSTKIGWAGDDAPKSYFRSNVAVLKEENENQARKRSIQKVNYDYYTHVIEGQDDGDWQISNPIHSPTGLCYDANSNYGADWCELFQKFIHHGYSTGLAKSNVTEHPLLLAERSFNPPPVRQQMLECLFEELNVPATFLAKDAVLACYGCGRTTGTVIDIGYSGTTVTPVFDGYAEPRGIRRSPAGIMAMDELILEQLDTLYQSSSSKTKHKHVMPRYQVRPIRPGSPTPALPRPVRSNKQIHHAARLEIAKECRELGAGAAMNLQQQQADAFHAPHKPFTLPDGTTILDVPSANRFAAADLVYGSDPLSVQRREALLVERKKELNALIDAAVADDQNDSGDNKFTDEAAVGLSKRRTKRGASTSAATTTTRPIFSSRHLRAACAPHLQTLLDEQLTSLPVASMVCEAAYRCEREQQATLLSNIILGGGGSCLGPTEQAVPDVVKEQVEGILQAHTPGWKVKVMTPAVSERAILNWLGGSILGSLGTFHEMWITKAEYEEWGTAIVNRKCP